MSQFQSPCILKKTSKISQQYHKVLENIATLVDLSVFSNIMNGDSLLLFHILSKYLPILYLNYYEILSVSFECKLALFYPVEKDPKCYVVRKLKSKFFPDWL